METTPRKARTNVDNPFIPRRGSTAPNNSRTRVNDHVRGRVNPKAVVALRWGQDNSDGRLPRDVCFKFFHLVLGFSFLYFYIEALKSLTRWWSQPVPLTETSFLYWNPRPVLSEIFNTLRGLFTLSERASSPFSVICVSLILSVLTAIITVSFFLRSRHLFLELSILYFCMQHVTPCFCFRLP